MKPILKWAGGKRWLVSTLRCIWQEHVESDVRNGDCCLIEPFTGGMSIALGLNPGRALLNDINEHLINFYQQVKQGLTINFRYQNNRAYYYKMRDKFNLMAQQRKHMSQEAAGIFYFLIRTGYNGLCRFNSNGEFNVPFGRHACINYKADFDLFRNILQPWNFSHVDFEQLKLVGSSSEFIYADPPYDTEFTKYYASNFKWADQIRLAEWLAKHNGPVVASNQATARIKELYQDLGFEVLTISAPRSIACNGDRKPAQEILALRGLLRWARRLKLSSKRA